MPLWTQVQVDAAACIHQNPLTREGPLSLPKNSCLRSCTLNGIIAPICGAFAASAATRGLLPGVSSRCLPFMLLIVFKHEPRRLSLRKLSVRSRMLLRLVRGGAGTLKSEVARAEARDGCGARSWNKIPSDMHERSRRVSGNKSGSLQRLVRRSFVTALNT